jgi:hypothetical protein
MFSRSRKRESKIDAVANKRTAIARDAVELRAETMMNRAARGFIAIINVVLLTLLALPTDVFATDSETLSTV